MNFGGTNTSISLTATGLLGKMMNGEKPPNAFLWSYTPVKRPDTLPEAFRKLSELGPSKALCISLHISGMLWISRFTCNSLRFFFLVTFLQDAKTTTLKLNKTDRIMEPRAIPHLGKLEIKPKFISISYTLLSFIALICMLCLIFLCITGPSKFTCKLQWFAICW